MRCVTTVSHRRTHVCVDLEPEQAAGRLAHLHQAAVLLLFVPLQSVPVTVLAINPVTCGVHAAANEHTCWTDLTIVEPVVLHSMFLWYTCNFTVAAHTHSWCDKQKTIATVLLWHACMPTLAHKLSCRPCYNLSIGAMLACTQAQNTYLGASLHLG